MNEEVVDLNNSVQGEQLWNEIRGLCVRLHESRRKKDFYKDGVWDIEKLTRAIHNLRETEDTAAYSEILSEMGRKSDAILHTNQWEHLSQEWFSAARTGNVDVVKKCIKQGIMVDLLDSKHTALMLAASHGQTEVVKLLIDHQADVNFRGRHFMSAVLIASQNDHLEVAKLLVKHKADIHYENKLRRENALLYAAESSSTEFVKFLLDMGAYVNSPCWHQRTPLMHAVTRGKIDMTKLLINRKANVNLLSSDEGSTALTIAASGAFFKEAVMLLLDADADVNIVNKKGASLMQAALQKGEVDIIERIKDEYVPENAILIDTADLKAIENLWSNSHGIVYKAEWVVCKMQNEIVRDVMCKIPKFGPGQDDWFELSALKAVSHHPNLLGLLGICMPFSVDQKKHIALVTPCQKHSSVDIFLQNKRAPLSYREMISFGLEIAHGVRHLHRHEYVHNDIRARNFRVTQKHIVLADFSLTRHIHNKMGEPPKRPWRWCSPEIILSNGRFHDYKSDVWMVGIALWELLGPKEIPFSNMSSPTELYEEVKGHMEVPLDFPDNCLLEWKELVFSCCRYERRERVTLKQLIDKLMTLIGVHGLSMRDTVRVETQMAGDVEKIVRNFEAEQQLMNGSQHTKIKTYDEEMALYTNIEYTGPDEWKEDIIEEVYEADTLKPEESPMLQKKSDPVAALLKFRSTSLNPVDEELSVRGTIEKTPTGGAKSPEMTGILYKKSPKGFRGFHPWQKRYCVLSNDNFKYYKIRKSEDADTSHPSADARPRIRLRGEIKFSEIRGVEQIDIWQSNRLLITTYTSRRRFEFKTGTADDCVRWYNAFESRINAYTSNDGSRSTSLCVEKSTLTLHKKDEKLGLHLARRKNGLANGLWWKVKKVTPDSAAHKAGVVKGNLILQINGVTPSSEKRALHDLLMPRPVVVQFCDKKNVPKRKSMKIVVSPSTRNLKSLIEGKHLPSQSYSSTKRDSLSFRTDSSSSSLIAPLSPTKSPNRGGKGTKGVQDSDTDTGSNVNYTREQLVELYQELIKPDVDGNILVVKDRTYRLKSYTNCFVARELVDQIMKRRNIPTRAEAVAICKRMFKKRVIVHVARKEVFKDGYLFYKLSGGHAKQLSIDVSSNKDKETEIVATKPVEHEEKRPETEGKVEPLSPISTSKTDTPSASPSSSTSQSVACAVPGRLRKQTSYYSFIGSDTESEMEDESTPNRFHLSKFDFPSPKKGDGGDVRDKGDESASSLNDDYISGCDEEDIVERIEAAAIEHERNADDFRNAEDVGNAEDVRNAEDAGDAWHALGAGDVENTDDDADDADVEGSESRDRSDHSDSEEFAQRTALPSIAELLKLKVRFNEKKEKNEEEPSYIRSRSMSKHDIPVVSTWECSSCGWDSNNNDLDSCEICHISRPLPPEAKEKWRWRPPESLNGETATNEKTDVWMFGVALWELAYPKSVPFEAATDREHLFDLHEDNEPFDLRFRGDCAGEWEILIQDCCKYLPGDRPSLVEVLQRLQKLQTSHGQPKAVEREYPKLAEEKQNGIKSADRSTIRSEKLRSKRVAANQMRDDFTSVTNADIAAKLLDEKPRRISSVNEYGRSSLVTAVQRHNELPESDQKENVELMKLLIERKVNINSQGRFGTTALLEASKHPDLLSLFLDHNAEAEHEDEQGYTSLARAIMCGHQESVPVVIPRVGKSELMYVAAVGDVSHIKHLIKSKIDPDQRYLKFTALSIAAFSGSLEVVKALLYTAQVDVNATCGPNGISALSLAARGDHIDICKTLIRFNAEVGVVDKSGDTAITDAAQRGHVDIVALLLKNKASLQQTNHMRTNALVRASGSGHVNVVKYLLEQKADVNVFEGYTGCTPLSKASVEGHTDVAKMLVEYGANPDALVGGYLQQSILVAVAKSKASSMNCAKRVGVLKYLVENGCSLDVVDTNGETIWSSIRDCALGDDFLTYLKEKYVSKVQFINHNNLKAIRRCETEGTDIAFTADLSPASQKEITIPVICKVPRFTGNEVNWRELEVLLNVTPHPNFSQFLGVCMDFPYFAESGVALVTLRPGDPLRTHIKIKDLSYSQRICYGIDMAKSLVHMHGEGYTHNDVALRSFLVSTEKNRAVLTNFCLSCPNTRLQ